MIARSAPNLIKYAQELAKKKAVRSGGRALIEKYLSSGSGDPGKAQLGSAAADDAGFVTYSVSIGAQTFSGVVNIEDEFVWVDCSSTPPGGAFVKFASAVCQKLVPRDCGNTTDCDYIAQYAAGDTVGYLASGTFTAAVGADSTTTVPPVTGTVTFGCGTKSTVPLDSQYGIIGFSQGEISLVKQLKISRFSYFLAPDNSDTSTSFSVVLLNDEAKPDTNSRSTPLVRGNLMYPDLYYVKLIGIQVDGQALTGIPAGAFDVAADGNSGGVYLSTMSAITYLQRDAYNAVRRALVSQIKSQEVDGSALYNSVFDLCYNLQAVAGLTFPKLTLVFDGSPTPTMELTTVNYFYKHTPTGLQCLTMRETPADAPFSSILGSLLQTGTNMIYDIAGGSLTFEKGAASALSSQVPSSVRAMAPLYLAWVLLF